MANAPFATLPMELKAKIVAMASDQEAAWDLRVKDYAERAGHINCLSSIALVNKELRDLAAKHQFRVLFSDRASMPVFRFSILQRYGHHIVEISFGEELEGAELSLSIMDRLPALCELSFRHGAATRLFGSGVTLRPDLDNKTSSYRASILALVADKISSLSLFHFPLAETVALITMFPNLTTLLLLSLEDPDHEEEVKSFTSAVASLRKLRDLCIEMNDESTGVWPAEALASLARAPPPVTSLELYKLTLDPNTIHLIEIFSTTVRYLILDLKPQVPAPDLTSITPIQLPHLTALELVTVRAQLPSLFHILTSASTLSLFAHYSHYNDDVPVEPTDPTLLSFLNAQPSLREVYLWDTTFKPFFRDEPRMVVLPSPSYLVAYANLVKSRGLDPTVLDLPHLTPFHPNAYLDYTENEGNFLTATLRRSLQFGMDELDRMEAEGNVAKAVRWVPRLKALEDERLAWLD